MILTCPECATRYQTDAAAFQPSGRRVRCAKCGHVWFQQPPQPEPAEAEPPPAPEPPQQQPERAAYAPPAPEQAHDEEAPPRTRFNLPLDRLALVGGWLGLGAVILLIGWAAISYRQEIATLWPQSSSLYSALGLKVNARGIAFTDVTRRYETENDEVVLAVSGNIVNVSKRELPVPQVRVILTSSDARVLYHWNFTPDAATLAPGKSVHFLTRLSNPPGAARHLQLRFADAGG